VIAVEGNGGFGAVFRLFDRESNQEFAIKIEHQSSINNSEIKIYKKLLSSKDCVPVIYTHGRAILTKAFNGMKQASKSIRHVTFESKDIASSDTVSYILMEPGVCSLLDMMIYKSETEARCLRKKSF